jgi:hypothetical protein
LEKLLMQAENPYQWAKLVTRRYPGLQLVSYGGHLSILWSYGAHKETASLWKELSRNHQFDMCEKITALMYNAH